MKKRTLLPDLFTYSAEAETVRSGRVRWSATYRLIPSHLPTINVFERVAPKEDWETLYALEGLTNPRLRDEAGNIRLVPTSRRVTGTNATVVMAAFTHCSRDRPSRFTDGTFGVYYAGHAFETALLEVAFHRTRFHLNTNDPAMSDQFRAYKGSIHKTLHDIRGGGYQELLSPDASKYAKPQRFASALRNSGSNGIVYPSVRHVGGECIAAFWPDVVKLPVQERHIELRWDGTKITEWCDFATGVWSPMPA